MKSSLAFRFLGLAIVFALGGCGDPTAEMPAATVSAPEAVTAAPAPAVSPATPSTGETSPAPAATPVAGALQLSGEDSTIGFVGSKVTGSHKGGFKTFDGSAELTPDGKSLASISVKIEMDSTWADSDKLSGHLKNQDFFDVDKFPTATFASTEIKPAEAKDATHMITGNLTLHGVTKSISFPATVKVEEGTALLNSEFKINRKDFGISYTGMTNDLIREDVGIQLAVKASKKP